MAVPDEQSGFRWLSEYEKTWEVIQEGDDGSLQASIDEIIHKAKRKRILARKGNVRLGMMRHLFIIMDMSRSMKESDLLRPNRLACVTKLLESFIIEYFDQNPISQLGIITTKNKRAEKLTELSGNPRMHVSALQAEALKGPDDGEPSLQNSLKLALSLLRHLPSHASREVLLIYGSLTTCDPEDIHQTIAELKENNIRCSVLGLSAEIKVCKTITQETNGSYHVILDEKHCKDLLLEHIRPPEAKVNVEASLIRMGFPKHSSNEYPALCLCHIEQEKNDLKDVGYFCPQCFSQYCELPVECEICGLTLVSAPHLARSYQHLFPLPAFEEVKQNEEQQNDNTRTCQGCQNLLKDPVIYKCQDCSSLFCNDCDLFVHETLHTCPGCSSQIGNIEMNGIG